MSKHNNQYCVNPETNRNIRIGGKTWMRLVKSNKLAEGTYQHPNVGFQTKEVYDDADDTVLRQLEEQKQYMIDNNQVPTGKTLHIKPPRKGFRKRGKIVYRDHNLTAHEATKNTADAAMNVIDQIQNGEIEVPANMNREQAHEYLQGLIFNKMLSAGTKFKNMKLSPKNISVGSASQNYLQKPPLIRQTAEPKKKYKTIAPKKKVSTRVMIPKRAPPNRSTSRRPVISERNDNIVYEDYESSYSDVQSERPTDTEYEEEEYEEPTEPETEYEEEVEYVYE